VSKIAERLSEARRLAILLVLKECPAYETNEAFIAIALRDLGLPAGHDLVRIGLAWLRDAGLLEIDEIAGVMISRLTRRGLDAAAGNTAIPGVQRPEPPR
jgi:DNA-binding transcriptional ArsR family regulator